MKLLLDFILITGMLISTLVIVFLYKLKNRSLDKNILILIFLYVFFVNIYAYSEFHEIEFLGQISYLFDYTFIWCLGPLLLLYIKSLFLPRKNILKSNMIHFIPVFLVTVFIFIPRLLSSYFVYFQFDYLNFYNKNQLVFVNLRDLYFLLYLFISFRTYNNLSNIFKSTFSNPSKKDISWIRKLLFGSLIFVLIDLLVRFSQLTFLRLNFEGGYITLVAIIFFMIYLSYNGISQSKILVPKFLLINDLAKNNNEILSTFSDNELKEIKSKLYISLNEKRLFLDEELTLKKLADSISISERKLSLFLNSYLKTKFYDYINYFRVEEVKIKLKSNKYSKYTILSIANESGFSSKASFNRAFKKHTGYSPSEFRKLD